MGHVMGWNLVTLCNDTRRRLRSADSATLVVPQYNRGFLPSVILWSQRQSEISLAAPRQLANAR